MGGLNIQIKSYLLKNSDIAETIKILNKHKEIINDIDKKLKEEIGEEAGLSPNISIQEINKDEIKVKEGRDKHKEDQDLSNIDNIIHVSQDRQKKYISDLINKIMFSKDLIEQTKTFEPFLKDIENLYDSILNSNPMYRYLAGSMFKGSITLPGIGNIWIYQLLKITTGIDAYDNMQGKLTKGRFVHTISGVSHTVNQEEWTTEISFIKSLIDSK